VLQPAPAGIERPPELPELASSYCRSPGSRTASRSMRRSSYIRKPIRPEAFIQAVRTIDEYGLGIVSLPLSFDR
jgi:hypothetical protein